jgi:hypothetical protein
MYTLVYENRGLGAVRSFGKATLAAGLGVVLLGGAAIGLVVLVSNRLGLVHLASSGRVPERDTGPLWLELLVLAGVAGIGAFSVAIAREIRAASKERAAREASGEALPFVVGPPRFEADSEGTTSTLFVGGRRFEDVEKGWGRDTEEYRWGSSTTIRGELRVHYLPDSGVLVRAEWRPYPAEELLRIVDDVVSRGRAFSPDLARRLPGVVDDPKGMAEAKRVVEALRLEILAACDRIEALRPRLLPGTPRRERDRAEEQFDLESLRIDFTKKTINGAIKVARRVAG